MENEIFNPRKRMNLILTRTEKCNAECCDKGQHDKEFELGIGIDLLSNKSCYGCRLYNLRTKSEEENIRDWVFHWTFQTLNKQNKVVVSKRDIFNYCSDHSVEFLNRMQMINTKEEKYWNVPNRDDLINDNTIEIKYFLKQDRFFFWKLEQLLKQPSKFVEIENQIESKLSYLKDIEPQIIIESLQRKVGKDMWQSSKEYENTWDVLWDSIKTERENSK